MCDKILKFSTVFLPIICKKIKNGCGIDSKFPWERVLYDDLKTPAELNDGAVWFDDDYESTDNRIYMFLQREKGHVKSYGEITGGHTTDTTAYGEMWWNK